MARYVPALYSADASMAGTIYNVLLEGTLAVDSQLRRYGYMLVPEGYGPGESGGLRESTDLADKDQLTQYASPNVIDRDLVRTPRVTQGDFTGGQGQSAMIDFARFAQSDLNVDTAGYLQLRSKWNTMTAGAATGHVTHPRIVLARPSPYGSLSILAFQGETTTTDLFILSGGTITKFTAPVVITDLDSDGQYVYISAGAGNSIQRGTFTNPGPSLAWSVVSSTTQGQTNQIWVVKLSSGNGLSGYYLYYLNTADPAQLWRIDLTQAFPVAVGNHVQVSLIANDDVIDLAPFEDGIAILGRDGGAGGSCHIDLHDGVNTRRLLRIAGYDPRGMCQLLGNLYIALQPSNSFGNAVLARVSASGFEIVADFGGPAQATSVQSIAQPFASGNLVFVSVGGKFAQFNVDTGAVSYLPTSSGIISTNGDLREAIAMGRSVLYPAEEGGNITLHGTQDTPFISGTQRFQSSGYIVGSLLDFGTPSIPKQFRRVTVYHAPLPANTTVKCDVFADSDPTAWTSGATPLATLTNSTASSTSFALQLPSATMALGVYVVLTLTTSDGVSTPVIKYYSVEANALWTFRMKLDATSRVAALNGSSDPANLKGKDRYMFLHEAWEDSIPLVLYHPSGLNYNVVIESLDQWSKAPKNLGGDLGRADFEAYADVVLRVTSLV